MTFDDQWLEKKVEEISVNIIRSIRFKKDAEVCGS